MTAPGQLDPIPVGAFGGLALERALKSGIGRQAI
jgi:hypothetical protein